MMNSEYADDLGGQIAKRKAKAKEKKKVIDPRNPSRNFGDIFATFIPPEPPEPDDESETPPSFRKSRGDVANLNADIRAKARGCYVVDPEPNELFIDIDREEDFEFFKKNVNWLKDLVECWHVSPSPSGKSGHYHIVVTLKRAVRDAYERIGLQAILGSDRLREVLSWRNALNNSGRPTCFFEREPSFLKRNAGKLELMFRRFIKKVVN